MGYRESPNRFDLTWESVVVSTADGEVINGTGIESIRSSNFLRIIPSSTPTDILWIPFEAIKAIAIDPLVQETAADVIVQKEAYNRFGFVYDSPTRIEGIKVEATISLQYPLPDGMLTVGGRLSDSTGAFRVYSTDRWVTIPWTAIIKLDVVRKPSNAGVVDKKAIPRFLYRTSNKFVDGWWEYRLIDESQSTIEDAR